jgi:hypothetical protein
VLSASGQPFHARHGSTILELDPDREIVAVNIERNIDILQVQVWTSRIVKAPNLATGQDEVTNSFCIARPALKADSEGRSRRGRLRRFASTHYAQSG